MAMIGNWQPEAWPAVVSCKLLPGDTRMTVLPFRLHFVKNERAGFDSFHFFFVFLFPLFHFRLWRLAEEYRPVGRVEIFGFIYQLKTPT